MRHFGLKVFNGPEFGADKFEIIIPTHNIEIFLPVTIIDKYAIKHKNYDIAKEYVEFLYSEKAQEIYAKHNFRPTNMNHNHISKFSLIKKFDQIELDDNFYHRHFDNKGVHH